MPDHSSEPTRGMDTASTQAAPASTLGMPLPTAIGDYAVVRLLGEGGMGAVYEAVQASPRRTVALKVIRPGILSPQILQRFQFEADALARLHHPNIAAIYDGGTAQTPLGLQPYFAMELIKGETITAAAKARSLGIKERLTLIAKLADAVHYAHTQGIIHRDLKPSNVLVDERGEPRILDFGLARSTNVDMHVTAIRTEIGAVLGTLAYMAPEQTTGNPEAVDTRADIYALGVIAYELLAGQHPYDFKRAALVEALRIIQEDEPFRLSSIHRTLRGDIDTIVAKAMEKDKLRRYQSASDLAADIRRHLEDQPISARPPSAWYQVSKFARRNKVLVGGALATLVTLVTGLIVSSVLAVNLKESNSIVTSQRDTSQRRLAATYARAAELAAQRGAWKDAADNARQAIDLNIDDPLAWHLKRAYYLSEGLLPDEALKEVELVAKADARGHYAGRIAAERGELAAYTAGEPRIKLYQKALAAGDLPPARAAFLRGLLSPDIRQAIAEFRKSLEMDPFDPNAHMNLGLCLAVMGENTEAMTHVFLFTQLRPDDHTALLLKAAMIRALPEGDKKLEESFKGSLAGLDEEERGLVRTIGNTVIDKLSQNKPETSSSMLAGLDVMSQMFRYIGRLRANVSNLTMPECIRPIYDGMVPLYLRASFDVTFGTDLNWEVDELTRLIERTPSPYLYYYRAKFLRGCLDKALTRADFAPAAGNSKPPADSLIAQANPGKSYRDLQQMDLQTYLASPAASQFFQQECASELLYLRVSRYSPIHTTVKADPAGARKLVDDARHHFQKYGLPDPAVCMDLGKLAQEVGDVTMAEALYTMYLSGLYFKSSGEKPPDLMDFQVRRSLASLDFNTGAYARALVAADQIIAGAPENILQGLPPAAIKFTMDDLHELREASLKRVASVGGAQDAVRSEIYIERQRLDCPIGPSTAPSIAKTERETAKDQLIRPATPSEWGISSACFSPDGKYIAVNDRSPLILELSSMAKVREFSQVSMPAAQMEFSPDGKLLTAAMAPGTNSRIALMGVASGHLLYQYPGGAAGKMVYVKPNIVTYPTAFDKIVTFRLADFSLTEKPVSFSRMPQVLSTTSLAGARDDAVLLVSLPELATLHTYQETAGKVLKTATTADASVLAAACSAGNDTVRISCWNREGTLLSRFEINSKSLSKLALSPDGTVVVVATEGLDLAFYEVSIGKALGTRRLTSKPLTVSFSPDSQRIAVAMGTEGAIVIPVPLHKRIQK